MYEKGKRKMKKVFLSSMGLLTGGIIGALAGSVLTQIAIRDAEDSAKKASDNNRALFALMTHWTRIKQKGKTLVEYFEKNNYKTIAVYGMSTVGQTLLEELKESQISVLYGIDKNIEIDADIEIVCPTQNLKPVDAVVVTAISYFDEVAELLEEKVDCPILSIEDILYEVE